MALVVDRKRSIGQASQEVGVQEHVLRFWETQFREYVKPAIGNGGRRYFYDRDIKILKMIRCYLYDKGYTIKGLQNLMKNETIELDEALSSTNDGSPEKDTSGPKNGGWWPTKIADRSSWTGPVGLEPSLRNDLKNFKVKLNSFYERLKNI
ncbi:MAG: MerR family transcriptional regulator [Rickettsiales bacterium]|jgi:DNA-binding transcriptional MerR regulator|nr:MerR family transcriptional regulator [Rickettsiales bacterium]